VYHVSTDNQYPYWVYAPQQDSGSIATRSRGNLGAITPLDWHPIAGHEFGSVAVDPLNPNVIYAGGPSPGIVKITNPSGQSIKVTRDHGATWDDVTIPNLPNPARADVSAIDASHQDPAAAYAAIDYHTTGDYKPYFYRTHDYGKTWTPIVNGLPADQPSGSFA